MIQTRSRERIREHAEVSELVSHKRKLGSEGEKNRPIRLTILSYLQRPKKESDFHGSNITKENLLHVVMPKRLSNFLSRYDLSDRLYG